MSDRAVAIDRSIIERQALIRFSLEESGDSPFDDVRAAVRIVTVSPQRTFIHVSYSSLSPFMPHGGEGLHLETTRQVVVKTKQWFEGYDWSVAFKGFALGPDKLGQAWHGIHEKYRTGNKVIKPHDHLALLYLTRVHTLLLATVADIPANLKVRRQDAATAAERFQAFMTATLQSYQP